MCVDKNRSVTWLDVVPDGTFNYLWKISAWLSRTQIDSPSQTFAFFDRLQHKTYFYGYCVSKFLVDAHFNKQQKLLWSSGLLWKLVTSFFPWYEILHSCKKKSVHQVHYWLEVSWLKLPNYTWELSQYVITLTCQVKLSPHKGRKRR